MFVLALISVLSIFSQMFGSQEFSLFFFFKRGKKKSELKYFIPHVVLI